MMLPHIPMSIRRKLPRPTTFESCLPALSTSGRVGLLEDPLRPTDAWRRCLSKPVRRRKDT